jgi:hypothetical protein
VPGFLDVPALLSYLGDTPENARERYAELISAPEEEPVSDTGVRAVATNPSGQGMAAPATG